MIDLSVGRVACCRQRRLQGTCKHDNQGDTCATLKVLRRFRPREVPQRWTPHLASTHTAFPRHRHHHRRSSQSRLPVREHSKSCTEHVQVKQRTHEMLRTVQRSRALGPINLRCSASTWANVKMGPPDPILGRPHHHRISRAKFLISQASPRHSRQIRTQRRSI